MELASLAHIKIKTLRLLLLGRTLEIIHLRRILRKFVTRNLYILTLPSQAFLIGGLTQEADILCSFQFKIKFY